MNTGTLHIFRPGRVTAMSGQTLEFTQADLAACAKAYDPAILRWETENQKEASIIFSI
jgi:hypothetical protein